MSNVKFDNIQLLYLFIPLFLLVVVPFFFIIKKNKFKFRNLLSLFLHILICALLSLSVAGIKTEEVKHETMIYFLVDVSNSSNRTIQDMDQYIHDFNEKISASSEVGIVVFGKNSEELVKPGQSIKSIATTEIDKSATNIQEALLYTSSLFDESYKKRIIVLSDGKETDGDVLSIADQVIDKNIRIDAVFFNSDLTDQDKEIQIDSVSGKNSTFLNVSEKMTIQIKSSYNAIAHLTIKDNDEIMYDQDIEIFSGDNELNIDCNTQIPGMHQYIISIDSDEDTTKENNLYYFNQEIHEKCEIAVISSSYSDSQYIENLIQENANVTSYITYNRIPVNIESYMKYDEIILSNVNLQEINNYESLVTTFENLVAVYGKSLLTLGGSNTYFNGSFYSTKLKDMIPVDINPEDTRQKTALILLIDNSGSMSGERLNMAKKGAISCLDVLTEQDYAGIITFEDSTQVIQPLMPITNKDLITRKINMIPDGNGTMMTAGLRLAYEQMKNLKDTVSNREVILISDGVPGDSGQDVIAKQMAEEGIVLSTINIGLYNDSLLASLAQLGNGRSYTINSADKLPSIMLNEVGQVVMQSIIEEDVKITISAPKDPIVKDITSLPNINGYNFSKAKYNTTTVLNTKLSLDTGATIENVPLYVYWNYGEGLVSSFMSDISTNWSKSLFDSETGKKLFLSMVTNNFPKEHVDSYLKVEVNSKGATSRIDVSVPKIIANTELDVKVVSPSGKEEKLTMAVSNGKYTNLFSTDEQGTYTVYMDYKNKKTGDVYQTNTTFTYSYSTEYNEFAKSDNILLWQLTNNSGTVSNDIDEIVNIEQEDVIYSQYYYPYLLILSLILFVLDVIIRKLRWKDITNLFHKSF